MNTAFIQARARSFKAVKYLLSGKVYKANSYHQLTFAYIRLTFCSAIRSEKTL